MACLQPNGMRTELVFRNAAILVFAALFTLSCGSPYFEEDSFEDGDDYSENGLDKFLQQTQNKRTPAASTMFVPMRRACLRRGANCDNRREDCCYNSTCRCNLFGSNCKCQRMGLFQKWGK